MKRTNKRELNLNQLTTGCAPCLNEALKIDRQAKEKSLNQRKINKIKSIVSSILKDSKNVT